MAALAVAIGCSPGATDSVGPETGLGGSGETGETDAPSSVGILSLNLHCLKTDATDYSSNAERFEAIARAVRAEGVQAIALQELCERPDESAGELLLAALEAFTVQDWSLAVAFAHTGWEGTEDEADEYVGLAVQGSFSETREVVYHVQDGLQRVAVAGTWTSPFGALTLLSVHLDHQHDGARLSQARQSAVEALVSESGAAAMVLGDFNDTPDSDAIRSMLAMGFEDLGRGMDDDRIDYVFAHRGAPVRSDGVERIFTGEVWPEVSDHPGVVAMLGFDSGSELALTTVSTEYGADSHYLAVRGDVSPLDWEQGWPASRSGDTWTAAFSEVVGSFDYKWLLDDTTWQQGDNLEGQARGANGGSVTF